MWMKEENKCHVNTKWYELRSLTIGAGIFEGLITPPNSTPSLKFLHRVVMLPNSMSLDTHLEFEGL